MQWPLAHVTPFIEGGETNLIINYRSIALTSIPCKILEHIVLYHFNEKVWHSSQLAAQISKRYAL